MIEYNLTPSLTLFGKTGNYQTLAFNGTLSSKDDFPPTRSSLDTASLHFQHLSTGADASFLHSQVSQPGTSPLTASLGGNSALTLNFHTLLGRISWNESLLRSFSRGQAGSSMLLNGIGLNLNSRLRLTESVNVTSSGPTFSHGGTFLTSYSSFEVDYQVFYLVTRPQQPFQQAMVFDAQVRLPKNLALHAASTVDSTGRTLYTVQLATVFDRDRRLPDLTSAGELGINTLQGKVIDASGNAVEGAVLLVGQQRLYTGADGAFFFRERRSRVHPFRVLTDEFSAMDTYVARSAPTQVKTSARPAPLTIVVERVPAMQEKETAAQAPLKIAYAGNPNP